MMSMIFMVRPERWIIRDDAGWERLAAGQNSIV
jgi:hypothetical protein